MEDNPRGALVGSGRSVEGQPASAISQLMTELQLTSRSEGEHRPAQARCRLIYAAALLIFRRSLEAGDGENGVAKWTLYPMS